jgi:hypothetical protein
MKKFGIIVLAALVIAQFFKPEKNIGNNTNVNNIPEDVLADLKTACYDCHSNNTVYPWYSNIQPVAWWLNDHIVDGKKDLNFDEVITKPKKYKKIVEEIEEGEMPLSSYTLIHRNAKLNAEQKARIIGWAKSKGE